MYISIYGYWFIHIIVRLWFVRLFWVEFQIFRFGSQKNQSIEKNNWRPNLKIWNSSRTNQSRTIISKILDKEWFKSEILANINRFVSDSGHERSCDESKRTYRLKGYRPNNRKVIVAGKKLDTPIRIIQCKSCGKVFSVMPSFISREKHYSISLT